MLHIEDLVVRYGSAVAVDGVSLEVAAGEMVALVGPNGAGKSTLINTISGLLEPASGSVRCEGRVAQVPEGRQMFADMSVEDNLLLGGWSIRNRDLGEVFDLLPDLARLRRRKAGRLSGGQQQMVAVGPRADGSSRPAGHRRALPRSGAARRRRAGRPPATAQPERGTAVLLVEQEVALAFDVCPRACVLEAGRVIASGPSRELAGSDAVRKAYFGDLAVAGDDDPGCEPDDGGVWMNELVVYLVSGVALGSSFALIGSGFVVVHRVTRVVNFAQGSLAVVGGMVSATLLDGRLPHGAGRGASRS